MKRQGNSEKGKYRRTAQFRMTYLTAVERTHIFYYSVNINNFELRLRM